VRLLQSKLQGKADELALMQRSRQSDIADAAQEAARQTEARMRVAGVTAWSKANKDGKPSATPTPAGTPGARPQRPDLP
jgi:phage baseplate assembly protein W